MDHDIDIARALDTIAEEISTKNMHSELPFELQFYNEGGKELSDQLITTLRAAMRAWVVKQDLENRIFRIARMVIKYGDCFFQKTSDFKKWRFIAPRDILGIEIDEMGVIVAYHVRKGVVDSRTASLNYQTDVIPAAGIIHFTLSDSMGPSAPFGESVLAPIVRTFRQLGMLEDSMLIYRIVRAPERRVFYVDVGNMPAQRVQQYLDKIKNDIRQKRTPNGADANNPVVDGSYNPQCLTLDTRIPLLDGRTLSLSQMIMEHEEGKQNWVYSCNPQNGNVVPGIVSWAGVTRKNAKVIELILDNGQSVKCTPDHKFPTTNRGFVEAAHLTTGDRIIAHSTDMSEQINNVIKTHFVLSIGVIESQDTGCITVDGDHVYHDYHTFALESGVFTRNSMQEDFFFPVTANGRGSRVETLPGGTGLGENADLLYFQEKIFRGLRVPMSYMMSKDGAGGGVYNDGKVGVAFIEEMRFANYVKRFQNKIEHVFTQQFKDFLKSSQIKVDSDIFTLRLPDPQNFALYRQAALDAELINTFNSADNIKYLSKQFILQRYLGLTDEEIKQNEELLMNERSIIEGAEVPTSQQMYDPAVYENREAVKVEAPEPEAAPEEAPPEEDVSPEEAPPEEPPADETPEVDLTDEEPPEEEAPKEKPAKEPKP